MRDLETLFERPPAGETDLAHARARFVAAAAKSRPRGWRNRLGPLLAALATALVGVTAAVLLRPVPAAAPRPPEPDGRQILLRAAEAALAAPPRPAAEPGQYHYVRWRFQKWDNVHLEMTYATKETWTPATGRGPWLERISDGRELRRRDVCAADDPNRWPRNLRAELAENPFYLEGGGFVDIASRLERAAFHPEQTAALLRIAAELPGLVVTRSRDNAAGVPAITVGVGSELRQELIFDAGNLAYLGDQVRAREPGQPAAAPTGMVLGKTLDAVEVRPSLPEPLVGGDQIRQPICE